MKANQTAEYTQEGVGQESSPTMRGLGGHLGFLFQGSTIYIVGDLATKALAFILIPLYTRYLAPADYGIIEIVKAVSTVLAIVCLMGLNASMTRYYFDYSGDGERRRFIGNVSVFLVLNALAVVFILDRFGDRLSGSLFQGIPFDPYLRLAIWTVFFGMAPTIMLTLYRTQQEPAKYVWLQLCQSGLGFGLILYFVVVRGAGALGKIQGEFCAAIVMCALAIWLVRSRLELSWPFTEISRSLKFGVPLVPHLLFWWIVDLSDRMFLKAYGTLDEVGIYSLGYNIATVMAVVITGFNNAWAPYFFSSSAGPEARDRVSRLLTYSLSALLFVGLVFCIYARELVVLISTPQYYAAYKVVPIIVVGYIFSGIATILANALFYRSASQYMPLLSGLAAASNVGLNILLIPRFGMLGAAYATAAAMGLYACIVFLASQRVYRVDYEIAKIMTTVMAFIAVLALGTLIALDNWVQAVALKSLLLLAFAVVLWRGGVVSTAELTMLGRKVVVRKA